MLADMLMELKRSTEALAEYKTDIKNAPNRFDGLLGAMRAAVAINSSSARLEVKTFSNQLMQCCGFGGDRPELNEVRRYITYTEQELIEGDIALK